MFYRYFLRCFTAGLKHRKTLKKKPSFKVYAVNKAPLRMNAYYQLPLGNIKPAGWLKEMLIRQKDGATGSSTNYTACDE